MTPCRNGHDKDALPRADGGRCRLCQRIRQRAYRATPRGRALNLRHQKLAPSRARQASRQRIRYALNLRGHGDKDRARARKWFRLHPGAHRAYQQRSAAEARARFPGVPDYVALQLVSALRRSE